MKYISLMIVMLVMAAFLTGCTIHTTDDSPKFYIENNNKPTKTVIPMIRVRLSHHKGQTEVNVKTEGSAKFYTSNEDKDILDVNVNNGEFILTAKSGMEIKTSDGKVTQSPGEYLRINSDRNKFEVTFKNGDKLTILGELVIAQSKEDSTKFDIIVRTDLETYCAQVLFNEMPESFDKEALKAQSVATRTYALFKILENSPEERKDPWLFDLENTQQDTVFNPSTFKSEAQEICKATFGEVITAKDVNGNQRIFPAYYHSTCGGATASAWDAHGTYKNLAPLQGAKTDYCKVSPIYTWKRTYSWLKWRQLLIDKQYTTENMVKELKGFEISDADRFGRAREFKFTFEKTASFEIQAIVFRNKVVGPGKDEGQLPSTFITNIKLNGDVIEIEGKGWGHGCGMCQWGADQLSKDGKTYIEIMQIYYPGSDIWGYYK